MKTFTVTRCTWYDTPRGAWSWNGYCNTTPAGCISEAVACGDGDLMGVTIDDADDLANKFVDGDTGKELDRHMLPPLDTAVMFLPVALDTHNTSET
jgi:hypothetical protein